MKSLFYHLCRLSCYLIILLAASCTKASLQDEQNEQLYTLNLKMDGFTSSKKPLIYAKGNIEKLASTNAFQQESDDYLFFWSFNQENLVPDIRIPSAEQTKITYNDGLTPSSFVNSTYSSDGYVAGRALSIKGASQFIIEAPLNYVQQLTTFGFDIGSSNTGPKDFEIYYSLDGEAYELLQESNQFGSATADAKNSLNYDLHDLPISGARLWIKLELKAGDRMGGSEYNPTSGTFRIDNLHFKGTYALETSADIAKLHYFIYHQNKPDIYAIGEIDQTDWGNFEIQLPLGRYDVFLISNQSNMELIFPTTRDAWPTLFASNYFINDQAEIFGIADEIYVSQNESFSFTLNRMYSQIKFEFTDSNLSLVDKIVITPLHDPFFYNPSGVLSTNPILDQTELEFTEGFRDNKQLVFNQFLGLLSTDATISYQLEVYSSDDVIRTLTVTSALNNNIQMVFRGELLNEVPFSHGFAITKNEIWGEPVEATF